MRIALFPVSRIVGGRGFDGWPIHDRQWFPAFTIFIGMLPAMRVVGLEVTIGVRRSIHEGERVAAWCWCWGVRLETLRDHPWTWWAPVRPCIDRNGVWAVEWRLPGMFCGRIRTFRPPENHLASPR